MSPHSAGQGSGGVVHGGAGLEHLVVPALPVPPAPPYSVRANVLVAFFGGVYAILLFSYLNSRRTGRVRDDGPVYAALAVLWTLAILWLSQSDDFGGLLAFALPAEQRRDYQLLSRVASLAVCGLLYLRLRPLYLRGEPAESPARDTLAAGLLAFLAGTGLTLAVGFVGLSLHRL